MLNLGDAAAWTKFLTTTFTEFYQFEAEAGDECAFQRNFLAQDGTELSIFISRTRSDGA